MKRRQFIQASLGGGLWSAAQVVGAARASVPLASLHWRDTTFSGLGTTMSIRAAHADAQALMQALERARDVVARVEDDMSLFRPSSALSQLNRTGVLDWPSPDLLKILKMSQRLAQQSQGAFDVTVQPLWQLYAQAQKDGRLPHAREVASAQKNVGWQHLTVSDARVSFTQSGMGVSLNGIAQGFAADAVRAGLKRDGVVHALINTGEWTALGLADGQRPWTLGIADPHHANRWLARVTMQGLSLATSADGQCAFSDDRKHHHIFNPHTGYSPPDIASVSVAATSCAKADALTKVLFVGGYAHALDLAKAWGVSALVVNKNGQWKTSETWPHVAS
ncbi:FAD:protein FMN transferase [Limnohabitans sp. TS-CS-82]|uniref:FAD:protein FMN transferase n=1 Tax=Limnohabitans sp. TS-CS-82 TaxID=2094193 RepID=UPI000CF20B52|nr:FAD:protein FMN transferase [Limnohabitans sp. TS-CS-82]PQA83695.1 FAD:protein FMN transferase [Limnohabitans sp. TS-CS-82]